jgi:biopolymer transport protein ExbD
MIDVLLVLIIIFMLITPLTPVGLQTLVPQPPAPDQPTVRDRDIVISVANDGTVFLNGERLDLARLPDRLVHIYRIRGDAPMFVRGDTDLEFRRIAEVIDIANGAGIHRVALMTH